MNALINLLNWFDRMEFQDFVFLCMAAWGIHGVALRLWNRIGRTHLPKAQRTSVRQGVR